MVCVSEEPHEEDTRSSRQDCGYSFGLQAKGQGEGVEGSRKKKGETRCKERLTVLMYIIPQNYASPVWMDINPSDTLQRESARDDDDERHICPLQLQVIERAIELWTNPDDLVFSPFAGIGSEGYVAVQNERRFLGIELKESYWKQACANLKAAEQSQPNLFANGEQQPE